MNDNRGNFIVHQKAGMNKTTFEHLADAQGITAADTFEDYPVWKHTLAFPPQILMGTTGTYELMPFLLAGHCWAQVVSHFLKQDSRVLDIGCGCGKTARFLVDNRGVAHYVGFDVIKVCIDWSSQHLSPRTANRFKFYHADLYNAEYNPVGTLHAREYHFPAADATVDLAFAGSLFTHLLEEDCRHYLRETARVLKPGSGILIISLHIEPASGSRYSGTEARIDVDVGYFIELAAAAGLSIEEPPFDLCGQEILVFSRVGD